MRRVSEGGGRAQCGEDGCGAAACWQLANVLPWPGCAADDEDEDDDEEEEEASAPAPRAGEKRKAPAAQPATKAAKAALQQSTKTPPPPQQQQKSAAKAAVATPGSAGAKTPKVRTFPNGFEIEEVRRVRRAARSRDPPLLLPRALARPQLCHQVHHHTAPACPTPPPIPCAPGRAGWQAGQARQESCGQVHWAAVFQRQGV